MQPKSLIPDPGICHLVHGLVSPDTRRTPFRRLRLEGKEYIVKEGDVMHFRFNV